MLVYPEKLTLINCVGRIIKTHALIRKVISINNYAIYNVLKNTLYMKLVELVLPAHGTKSQ